MKDIVLANLGSTHFTQKSGDICLVANSPLTRLPACVIFFDCEMRLHLSANTFEVSL